MALHEKEDVDMSACEFHSPACTLLVRFIRSRRSVSYTLKQDNDVYYPLLWKSRPTLIRRHPSVSVFSINSKLLIIVSKLNKFYVIATTANRLVVPFNE